MKIPSEVELAGECIPYCLDTEDMLHHFLGKTKVESIELFKKTNVVGALSYMAPVGFHFYLQAAFKHLKSKYIMTGADWEFPFYLLGAIHSQVATNKLDDELISLAKEISEFTQRNAESLGIEADDSFIQQMHNEIALA